MREFAVYTVARFALFFVCWGAVLGGYWLVEPDEPLPLLWPLLVAALVSMVLSTYLLRGMRERFAQRVQERAGRMAAHHRTEPDPSDSAGADLSDSAGGDPAR